VSSTAPVIRDFNFPNYGFDTSLAVGGLYLICMLINMRNTKKNSLKKFLEKGQSLLVVVMRIFFFVILNNFFQDLSPCFVAFCEGSHSNFQYTKHETDKVLLFDLIIHVLYLILLLPPRLGFEIESRIETGCFNNTRIDDHTFDNL